MTIVNCRTCLLALSLLSLTSLSPGFAQQTTPRFNSYITAHQISNIPGNTPDEHYDCSDTIYSVIEVTEPVKQEPSHHKIVVKWFNPGDKLEQNTRYDFTSYGKGSRGWAWLKLSGPTGAALGRIFDPAFGMGGFIGNWRVEILVDDKLLASQKFDVLC